MPKPKFQYWSYKRKDNMSISAITKAQAIKIVKALGYAFVSAFIVGISTGELSRASLLAATVAGVNAVLVAVKQLFTEG